MVCPESHKHGASTGCYTNHKCRCDACRAAMRHRRANPVRVPVELSVPCVRCGVARDVSKRRNRAGLCRDCWYVLSREELAVWV